MTRDIRKERQVSHQTFHQLSTATALDEGVYRGPVRVGMLRQHGDLGLGTFKNLDGEMVLVDGHCFQVRGDGSVQECDDRVLSSFALVTRFAPDATFTLGQCPDVRDLTSRFDTLRTSDNLFLALRVDGRFDHVRTSAMCPTSAGVRSVDAAAVQPEFELYNVSGTLVGFWSPDYAGTLEMPGYHLHFVSDDRESGGHLLQCRGVGLRLRVQREGEYLIALPGTDGFTKAEVRREQATDLDRAEQER
jgi:acetolactate decarboxylase